jgi:hypothetical protein
VLLNIAGLSVSDIAEEGVAMDTVLARTWCGRAALAELLGDAVEGGKR